MLTALSHADHWSRTNLRAGVIGMELSHTLTAVVMSEVDSPQLTENAVYGGFWADCGVRRPCTACELIVGKRGALLNSYPRALAGYLCRLVSWSYSLWPSGCWVGGGALQDCSWGRVHRSSSRVP